MIKIQKLNYHFLALLGAAALTSGLDMIPYVGHYLAVPVLLLSVASITRADKVDVLFTVFVGYALMFGMNLWLLGALMGDLRPSSQNDLDSGNDTIAMEAESEIATETNPPTALVQATNNAQERPAPALTQPASKPNDPAAAKLAREIAKTFALKGVIQSANKSMATIHTGAKTYTIAVGETLSVETVQGKTVVRCEAVDENSVVLTVAGERVRLSLW
jgi:Tfp pilus assembly protein PilP